MNPYLETLRPKQWYKNLLIFAGLFFTYNLFNLDLWLETILVFFLFCLVVGGIYTLNDIHDMKEDRKNPKKKKTKPVASGKISVSNAFFYSCVLLTYCAIIVGFINPILFSISLIYIIINLFYTLFFKKTPIVDVMMISSGFVIRLGIGYALLNVMPNVWLILSVFLIGMFLALKKRFHRQKSYRYSENLLIFLMYMSSTLFLIAYGLFCLNIKNMIFTIPIVAITLCWFNNINQYKEQSIKLLRSKGVLLGLSIWGLMCLLILYVL